MKYLIALTLALALQLVSAIDREAAKENIHNYRIKSQNLHIDQLVEAVEKLEEEFGKLSELPDKHTVDGIKARIRNLEDSGCDKDHVQCGGDVPECISPLLVCDGHKDCKNGRDEDDYTCSDRPYHVGSTIAGITSWTDCVAHSPHMTVVTITAYEKPEFYTSRVYVKAVVSFEVDEHSHLIQSYGAKGYWNAGKRALVLVPDSEKEQSIYGHAIVCKFNLGSHDEADCKIGTVASKHECATFRGARV
jgi:hypothetical protein